VPRTKTSNEANDASPSKSHSNASKIAADADDELELPCVGNVRKFKVRQVRDAIMSLVQPDSRTASIGYDEGGLRRRWLMSESSSILSKWIFTTFEHSQLDNTEVETGWRSAGTQHDPIIPSNEVPTLKHYLSDQLRPVANEIRRELKLPSVTKEELDSMVQKLVDTCSKAAKAVSQFAERKRRVFSDHNWTDSSIGVELIGGEMKETVGVRYGETTLRLFRSHLAKLRRLYEQQPHQRPERFLTRVFNMLMRYETLCSLKAGNQGALPPQLFELLHQQLGVTHECYASPLNCATDTRSFCSLFPDVDRFFGSCGSFFDFELSDQAIMPIKACSATRPTGGGSSSSSSSSSSRSGRSFECNPPFDRLSIEACFRRVLRLLAESEMVATEVGVEARDEQYPLSFFITCPKMEGWDLLSITDDNETIPNTSRSTDKCVADFLQHNLVLRKGEHHYILGLQHRPTRGDPGGDPGWGQQQFWKATHDTAVFVLQNEAGAKKWPVSAVLVDQLCNAFTSTERQQSQQQSEPVAGASVAKSCFACEIVLNKGSFSKTQWQKPLTAGDRRCKQCVAVKQCVADKLCPQEQMPKALALDVQEPADAILNWQQQMLLVGGGCVKANWQQQMLLAEEGDWEEGDWEEGDDWGTEYSWSEESACGECEEHAERSA
jgi:phosphorylated CTD-interacting factor 1